MLKILGAILVCLSSSTLGLRLVADLKEKVRFFQGLKQCLQLVRGEIRFGCSTLPEAFGNLKERTKEPLAAFFQEVGQSWLQGPEVPLEQVWEKASLIYGKEYALGKEEVQWFSSIGGRLGHLDKEMQINTLTMVLEELEQKEQHANSNLTEKGKLYPCIGTMSGVFVALLLI